MLSLIPGRRDKDGGSHKRDKSRENKSEKKIRPLSVDFTGGLFNKTSNNKKLLKEMSKQLQENRYTDIGEEALQYAVLSQYAGGDIDKACDFAVLYQAALRGDIMHIDPHVTMLGAQNRELVTCYLDALLFAMFARLESFEGILRTDFEDEPRCRLSFLLRLWINMLRSGRLIHTDITKHLQEAIAACGWTKAAELQEQDTSELFCAIADMLQLPLLELKMELFHNGLDGDPSDHQYVQERLINVAIPDETPSGGAIRLEDCLENYFSNLVSVRRELERKNTISSTAPGDLIEAEKASVVHVEEVEVAESTPNTPSSPFSPESSLDRSPSLVKRTAIEHDGSESAQLDSDSASIHPSLHKGSTRVEVQMRAWQIFNLTPWSNKHTASNNEQVAKHFENERPVLGICLKRYATENGKFVKKNTFVDIPLDIRLPHFIDEDDTSLSRNFKLSLQSIICHRGVSVTSGHYISYVRGGRGIADGDSESTQMLSSSSQPPDYSVDKWIKFDDLSATRVMEVKDIEQEMKKEMPYLIFYRVQPLYETSQNVSVEDLPPSDPPAYSEPVTTITTMQTSSEDKSQEINSTPQANGQEFDGANDMPRMRVLSTYDPPVAGLSFNDQSEERRRSDGDVPIKIIAKVEEPHHPDPAPSNISINLKRPEILPEDRRGSVAVTELSEQTTSVPSTVPTTPGEDSNTAQRLSRAAQFFANGKKSRRSSPEDEVRQSEGRLSEVFLRPWKRGSKEGLNKPESSRGQDNLGVTDAEQPRKSITIEDLMRTDYGNIGRSRSKKEKKRSKSKTPRGSFEKDNRKDEHSHLHLHQKEKGKGKAKDLPDRQCSIM